MNPTDDATGDPRPWDEPGTVRRDAEPHRGLMVLVLGIACMVVGGCCASAGLIAYGAPGRPALALVIASAVTGASSLSLGTLASALAGRDLRLMRAGVVEPGSVGTDLLRGGRRCAWLGMGLTLVGLSVGGFRCLVHL